MCTAATLPLQDSCTSTWLSEDKLRIEVNSTSCLCQPRSGIRLVQPVYAGAGIGFGSVVHSNTTCDLTYSHAPTYVTTSAGLESWNNDWHHCVGSHELHLGLQLQRQHPTKLHAVQRMIALLNTRGLAIGIAGPPGAGKSTLQGLRERMSKLTMAKKKNRSLKKMKPKHKQPSRPSASSRATETRPDIRR